MPKLTTCASVSVNVLSITVGWSPSCLCNMRRPPSSKLMMLRTVRPSGVSSSNSSSSVNEYELFLNVEYVWNVYTAPAASTLSATVGVTELAILRPIRPTPWKGTPVNRYFHEKIVFAIPLAFRKSSKLFELTMRYFFPTHGAVSALLLAIFCDIMYVIACTI